MKLEGRVGNGMGEGKKVGVKRRYGGGNTKGKERKWQRCWVKDGGGTRGAEREGRRQQWKVGHTLSTHSINPDLVDVPIGPNSAARALIVRPVVFRLRSERFDIEARHLLIRARGARGHLNRSWRWMRRLLKVGIQIMVVE